MDTHLHEFVRAVSGPYTQLLQQLHHQPTEALEGSRNADLWVDLYEYILMCVYVQAFQLASLVQWTIQYSQQCLQRSNIHAYTRVNKQT